MPPSPAEPAALVQDLADALKQEGHIRTPRVEMAFRVVPRHIFLPGVPFDQVYRDQSVITKSVDGQPISSSSQPAAMAIMLEQLGLEPGQRVLEIGAGTGYNAALLAQIVGDRGQVISVDLDPDLVAGAREHLAAVGLERVQVVCGDGGLGYPASAPYDRIVLSVGAWDITPAWQEQLAVGGRLLLPLELKGGIQRTVALQWAGDHFASISVSGCSFMMLRGGFAGAAHLVALGAEPGLFLTTDNP